jgi:hypothetical protein
MNLIGFMPKTQRELWLLVLSAAVISAQVLRPSELQGSDYTAETSPEAALLFERIWPIRKLPMTGYKGCVICLHHKRNIIWGGPSDSSSDSRSNKVD